jgi:hypothetical protein
MSWCLAPMWRPTPDFYYRQAVADYWCGAPSLTRRRVCRLQLLLVCASAVILCSESLETHDHVLLSQIRDSPNLEGQVPVFISPRKRLARLYPWALDSIFVFSYDSQGYGRGIRNPLPPSDKLIPLTVLIITSRHGMPGKGKIPLEIVLHFYESIPR